MLIMERTLCFAVCLAMASTWAVAETVVFTGGTDGKGTEWREPTNWSTGSVPGEHDEVKIADGRTAVLSHDAGTVTKLNLGADNAGGTLTITKGGKLQVYRMAFSGGSKKHPAVLNIEDGGYLKSHNEMYLPDRGGEGGVQIHVAGTGTLISWQGVPEFAHRPVAMTISGSNATVDIGGPLALGGLKEDAQAMALKFVADQHGVSPLRLGERESGDALQILKANLHVDATAMSAERSTELTLVTVSRGLDGSDRFVKVAVAAPQGMQHELAYDGDHNRVVLKLSPSGQ